MTYFEDVRQEGAQDKKDNFDKLQIQGGWRILNNN
jgi:hypothetical protein